MSDAITPQTRVTHLADRNKDVKRLGTVEQVWQVKGTWYARVKWDSEASAVTHPADNLVLAHVSR